MEATGERKQRLQTSWTVILTAMAVMVFVTNLKSESIGGTNLSDRSLAQTTGVHRPNILFLVLDQWRYDWDGMHKDTVTGPLPLEMPFLKESADRGMRFTQTYVPSPLCAPVRACLASGKEYDFSGVPENHADELPLETITFYKLLRDSGNYHTMSCGKDDLYHGDAQFPIDPKDVYPRRMDLGYSDARRSVGKSRVLRGQVSFERYRHFLDESVCTLEDDSTVPAFDAYKDCFNGQVGAGTKCDSKSFTNEIYPDDFVKEEAIQLLKDAPDGQPWFLQVNFPGPHPPIMATAEMARSVRDRLWPPPIDYPHEWHEDCKQKGNDDFEPGFDGRCNYAAQLEHLDSLMEEIVEEVKAKKAEKETIVCITGDHGEQLWDHGNQGKKCPWQPSSSVPLVCYGPGIRQNAEYDGPVTTLDLTGTWLDYGEVEPIPEMMVQSLRPVLEGTTDRPTRDAIHSGLANWRMVVKQIDGSSYKLVCCEGSCPHLPSTIPPLESGKQWQMLLFDVKNDPHDLSPADDSPDVLRALIPLLPEGWCGSELPSST